MKMIVTLLAGFTLAQAASAGQLTCSGRYMWMEFTMRASTRGTSLSGPIHVDVSGVPGGASQWKLNAVSSALTPAQSLSFKATSAQGGGELYARWDGQAYRGTMRAQTSFGNANVNVTCTWSERRYRWHTFY